MKEYARLFLIGIASLATHLPFFGKPQAVIFDEIYFLKFIGHYADKMFYFDPHPPFAKLLFYWFGEIFGITPTANIGTIGTILEPHLVLFRIVPLVAGILIPFVIYYICRELRLSSLLSIVAALLLCVENSLIVQSRLVVMDMILVLFGYTSILLYLLYLRHHHKKSPYSWLLLLISAITLAFTVSIKWTGLSYMIPIVVFEIYRAIKSGQTFLQKISTWIRSMIVYGLVFIVIYPSIFAIHFSLLPKSGPGDAFMGAEFRATLEGSAWAKNPAVTPRKFFGKFFELNTAMFESTNRIREAHNYGSKFYSWPFMHKPIYYWQDVTTKDSPDLPQSRIYLLGNPILYWLGTLSMIIICALMLRRLLERKSFSSKEHLTPLFLLVLYIGSWLPYALIGRVMFLYHYTAALIVSIIALAYLIDLIPKIKVKYIVVGCLMVVSISTFVFFSPLTYGLPLSDSAYKMRVWLPTWM